MIFPWGRIKHNSWKHCTSITNYTCPSSLFFINYSCNKITIETYPLLGYENIFSIVKRFLTLEFGTVARVTKHVVCLTMESESTVS